MTIAIIATVVGFLCGCVGVVPGIIAIAMANQVKGRLAQGNIAGAQQSAKNARTLAIVAFAIAGVIIVLGILGNVVGNNRY